MADRGVSIRRFYAGWDTYNERIVEVVRELSAEQLRIRPAPDRWPIWATVGHTAGMRVYWLCGVLGEPGAEATPFTDPLSGIGWEDDLDRPRGAEELVLALETTWRIVEGCLDRWTPAMLDDTFVAQSAGGTRVHTRQCGELSQTLGIHRLPQIDLWGPVPVAPAGDAK